MTKKLSIVMCGAHPDDIETYMGGTLIKYVQQGHDVKMLIATNGCKGGNDYEGLSDIRRNESLASAAILKLTPIFLGFEDGKLLYDKETFEMISNTIEQLNPDVIFTHDPNDYHSDHRALSRMIADSRIFVTVFFADTFMGVNFNPQFYVNVTDEIEIKNKMINSHKSQNPKVLIDMVNTQTSFRGAQCGYNRVKNAEAYRALSKSQCLNAYKLLPEEGIDFDMFNYYDI